MQPNAYTPMASFVDLLMDAVFAVNLDASIVFASASCERIFGYTPKEMIGKNMFDLMLPEDRERTRTSVQEVMSGCPQLHFENRYVRKDGQVVYIMWSARWSSADQLRIGVARDITERKRAESLQAALYAISEAAHRADDVLTLFQHLHQIVGTLLPVDDFSVALIDSETGELGFPYPENAGCRRLALLKEISGPLCRQIVRTGLPILLAPDTMRPYLAELDVSSSVQPVAWLGVPLKSQNEVIGVIVLNRHPGGLCYSHEDQALLQFVSTQIAAAIERQQMQMRLKQMAQYDQLTGLPNRALLYDRLKVALSIARREQACFSLLYLDIDKFKQVNDTLGHGIGDLLLKEVARRLKLCVRESDTVARVGGDEFIVLLHRSPLPEQAEVIAKKIRDVFSQPCVLNGHSFNIASSIGLARYPEHGTDESQLIEFADKSMYLEKKAKVCQAALLAAAHRKGNALL
ncbi:MULTISPECIES: GGDEF domain-containing protein [unclassified Pusillimonas]|uniref:GGDEF domain-containing protein n=1 Tax=unclassified Pusillimonas TaxID=2640016 RepID=UPI000B9D3F64|nr:MULTISPECIES: GGDEF domain-containing protein [unclassified Pusillimonas]OXR49764.1 diguanylate cyclase [Pusillimonas sp. T2]ROT45359.1 diguanylate cyclase [Pusillimonas sp. NJUB218]